METAMNYLPENYTENVSFVSSRSLVELVPVLPSPHILLPEAWEMFLPKQKWRQFRIRVMKLYSVVTLQFDLLA